MDENLNENLQLLGRAGKTSKNTGVGKNFQKRMPAAQKAIPRTVKWRYARLRVFCRAKA